jgi:hypothetical protein
MAMAMMCVPAAARAQAAGPADPSARWRFKGLFSLGHVGSDYGKGLEDYISGDFELQRMSPKGAWRYGFGIGLGSFAMKPPFDDDKEFALLRTYLSGARVFRVGRAVRPYLELQVGEERTHPRSLVFAQLPLPTDFKIGDSPTGHANGFGLTFVPGLETSLGHGGLSLDLSLQLNAFKTEEFDLTPIGQPPASKGTTVGGRFGLSWVPQGGEGGLGRSDAWGVHRSYGWATGEMLAINIASMRVNEYKRNANFNQLSPRSWWTNIEDGFTYDDDHFRTNQLLHPFNGSTYFNSARANGHDFYVSSLYALVGASFWECCGETHPMSFNDMFSTTLGGIALGEMGYRLSSKILDNTVTKGRFWRELAAMAADPVRGANRLISGASRHDRTNPSDPMDWRPPGGGSYLAVGVRTIGKGESISENTKTTGYFEFTHAYGNAFDNERNKPYDSFDLTLQFNFGDDPPLGQVQILGTLYKKPLGDKAHLRHVLEIAQHFDYMNNTNYEFGGQSFGPSVLSRFDLGDRWSLHTRLDGNVLVLGAINSEYAKIAHVEGRERLREYDYGPGLGTSAVATLSRGGRRMLTAGYRFQWINVSNGSVYNNYQRGISTSANHYIQMAGARLIVPVHGGLGIGADGTVFLRKSRYSIPAFDDIDQRNPQVRVYLTLDAID